VAREQKESRPPIKSVFEISVRLDKPECPIGTRYELFAALLKKMGESGNILHGKAVPTCFGPVENGVWSIRCGDSGAVAALDAALLRKPALDCSRWNAQVTGHVVEELTVPDRAVFDFRSGWLIRHGTQYRNAFDFPIGQCAGLRNSLFARMEQMGLETSPKVEVELAIPATPGDVEEGRIKSWHFKATKTPLCIRGAKDAVAFCLAAGFGAKTNLGLGFAVQFKK